MTGFKSPDRERFTALFASSISFPEREETRTWSGNNDFFLVNARVGVTYYIMRENLIWREFKVLAKFTGYTVVTIICSSTAAVSLAKAELCV